LNPKQKKKSQKAQGRENKHDRKAGRRFYIKKNKKIKNVSSLRARGNT
jgi:hypothetical protein